MTEKDACEVFFVDEAKVKSVAEKLAADGDLYQLTETFKLLGDPTRLKIILALKEEELCVFDLATRLSATIFSILDLKTCLSLSLFDRLITTIWGFSFSHSFS